MMAWPRFTLLALVLAGCTPDLEEVNETINAGSTGTTAGPTTTTTPDTAPPDTAVGTMGGTSMDTTMGAVDTTAAVATTDGSTTMGVEPTSSTGPECMGSEECPNNEICSEMGECVDACDGSWGMGNYGGCLTALGGLDTPNVCGPNHICIADPHPYEMTVCSAQSCTTSCDCPQPPATGTAVVTCASITSDDTDNDCYLSCANGETCPEGMECLSNGAGMPLLCAATVPTSVPMYGNCDDLVTTCDGGSCGIVGNASVCTEGCGSAGDCEPAPLGANAPDCDDVFNPPGGNECFLPCNFNPGDCPAGMYCIDVSGPGGACMF